MPDVSSPPRAGDLLREWRLRRRMSQMDLALEAGISTRHLSFVETGRSRPSAEMIVRLGEPLGVPFRDRNVMLLAAGHAPIYEQRPLEDPAMGPVRDALDQVLRGHEPYPAVVVDRHWGMVAANAGIAALTAGVDPALLEPPVNVLRLSLHPDGVAGRIVNLAQWRAHLLERLGRQAVTSGDPALAALREELAAYPGGESSARDTDPASAAIAVPLRLRQDDRVLSFISTVTTFDTATDVTVAELAIEAFYPADAETAAALRGGRSVGASGEG
jgi:transcriptional regulator with XRE-family HTH domain